MKTMQNDLFRLPSVEQILQKEEAVRLAAEFGRGLVLQSTRAVLEEARTAARSGGGVPDAAEILAKVRKGCETIVLPTLLPVINASGVILHTNLGRAPISASAAKAMGKVAAGYNTLEFELETGKRGSRISHVERLINTVTGAESAFVVCNNAAAVLLCLSALARRRPVAISRTQMVEIGDGFRIPEVLRQSGAKLVEIGTTNKVHLDDYREALEDGAAAVLIVHHSNFKLTGFTSEPGLAELADLTHAAGAILIDDLGSGALLDTARYGLKHEPTVQESLQAGADVVCFSGDKLTGGPQAGIIAGRREIVNKLRKFPLARAVRTDKMCLAGLAATFNHYAREEAETCIPVWQMISLSPESLLARANRWKERIGRGEIITGQSTIGGGSLPEEVLPTWLFSLRVKRPDKFLQVLRMQNPPIIARIDNDAIVLDPRTVFSDQEEDFLTGVQAALKKTEWDR